jgi:hypothetical protein
LVAYCEQYNPALGLSAYNLFELSRAPALHHKIDKILFELRDSIFLASLYDRVIDSELRLFPKPWHMRWLPLSSIRDFSSPSFVANLAGSPLFAEARDDHRNFGLTRYKMLMELKKNFSPLHDENGYTLEDASPFAWATSMDYLSRQFPQFLRKKMSYVEKNGYTSLDSLWSLRVRGLFLFIKYYLHNQLPNDSDFFDFAQVSYAPYCDVFVTEKNVSNVLRRIQSNGLMLEDTTIFHVSDFVEKMERQNTEGVI